MGRDLFVEGETVFRSVFCHRNDPSRELLLSILAFDVPG